MVTRLEHIRHTRLFRWLMVIVSSVLTVLLLFRPVIIGYMATIDAMTPVRDAPAGFSSLTLTTDDGIDLAGWYRPPENGAAILLLHGSSNSRNESYPYIPMLVNEGFGVLALDLRGHGVSGGPTNLLGWKCAGDVKAALDFLQSQDDVEVIGGLGISLGGEIMLSALSAYPELAAVISDGAAFRTYADFVVMDPPPSLLHMAQYWLIFGSVHLFSGEAPPVTMLDSIQASETPLLLIAAGLDAEEIAYNTLFADEAGGPASVWVVPDVIHTDGFPSYKQEYESRVLSFFDTYLLAGRDLAGETDP